MLLSKCFVKFLVVIENSCYNREDINHCSNIETEKIPKGSNLI